MTRAAILLSPTLITCLVHSDAGPLLDAMATSALEVLPRSSVRPRRSAKRGKRPPGGHLRKPWHDGGVQSSSRVVRPSPQLAFYVRFPPGRAPRPPLFFRTAAQVRLSLSILS